MISIARFSLKITLAAIVASTFVLGVFDAL
jgi:hypothetical protein